MEKLGENNLLGGIMTGFLIAIISGTLMSVQGVFNSEVTKATQVWVSSILVQSTALVTSLIMWYVTGRKSFTGIARLEHKYTLLGGVIGAFITYTVIKSIGNLGVVKANLFIVVSQLIVAYVIEILGLFGSEKSSFSMMKLVGILIAVSGVIIFSMAKTPGKA